jgi:hypothetical protein
MKLNLFKKNNKVFVEKNDDICSICLDTIIYDKIITDCGHSFHINCIGKSIKISQKCPYCRSKILKINYVIKLKKNFIKQIKKIKKYIGNNVEYLIENHTLLSFTIAIPILYLSLASYICFHICDVILNLFVKDNDKTEIEFITLQ